MPVGSAAARALDLAGAALTLAGASTGPLAALAADLTGAVTVPCRPETPDDAAEMVGAAVRAHGRLDGVLEALLSLPPAYDRHRFTQCRAVLGSCGSHLAPGGI